MRLKMRGQLCSEILKGKSGTIARAFLPTMLIMLVVSAASAQAPPIVVSQASWLSPFPPNGRALAAGNAAGTSFAMNSSGEILIGDTYNGDVLAFNGETGTMTNMGSFQNVGAVAVDNQDNLYVASRASGYIVKVPYKGGGYAQLGDPQTGPKLPACTGNDTAVCEWGANLYYSGNNYWFGVVSMTFDSAGDFFFATNDAEGGTSDPSFNPFSIFVCSATASSSSTSSCVTAANTGKRGDSPRKLFTEPAATPSTVPGCASDPVQVRPGGLAVDPWGNLYFTDSALEVCGNPTGLAYQSDASYLKEIGYSPSTNTYASAPVTLYTFIPSTITSYDSEVDAVAIDNTGTVYFATTYDGIFAFGSNTAGFTGPIPEQSIYGVSTTGSRVLALDGKGNLYAVEGLSAGAGSNNTVDTLGRVSVNSLSAPDSPVGTLVTAANVSVMVNDAACSSAPAVTFAPSGEFAGSITGNCEDSPLFGGTESSFAAKVTFTPAGVGGRSAMLTATETATGKSQPVIAFGVGQGGLVTLDPGNPPLSYSGFTAPAGISVDAAGDIFVADAGANKVEKISAGSMTLQSIGSGFSTPADTAVDTAGNLYVADTGNNQIVEIPTAAGTPGKAVVVLSSSTKIGGMALSGPTGLAIGDDGILYISDTGNNRVVTYNPANGVTGVRATGLNTPGGIAVDTADTLYVANAGTGSGGNIEVFPGGGGTVVTLTPSGVTLPVAVAVEPSGSLFVSDGPSGSIIRISNENGVLNASDAMRIESHPKSGGGIAIDSTGNLYTADAEGATVYAIQRTGSTIDFGSVDDGASAQSTVYAENAGNEPLALAARANSFLTQPATSNFSITAGTQNDCLAASFLNAGSTCEFTAEFSPALGVPSGALTDAASFHSTAVGTTAPIVLNGTAIYEAAPVPGFSISLGAPSLSIKPGGNASLAVSVTPQNGFNSPVTLSCSGLPAGATCSFSPSPVTPSGGVASSQLTVNIASTSAGLRQETNPLFPGGGALVCVGFCLLGFRRRRTLFALLLLALTLGSLGAISGCGTNMNPRPIDTTTTITVNAASGSIQNSATFTLTVQ